MIPPSPLIDDYLGSITTPEADPPSTQDGSPNGSQNFTQVTRRSTVVMLKPREKELRQRKPSKRLNEKTKSTLVKPLKRKGNSKLTFTKEGWKKLYSTKRPTKGGHLHQRIPSLPLRSPNTLPPTTVPGHRDPKRPSSRNLTTTAPTLYQHGCPVSF